MSRTKEEYKGRQKVKKVEEECLLLSVSRNKKDATPPHSKAVLKKISLIFARNSPPSKKKRNFLHRSRHPFIVLLQENH